jgi:hypothetical protein
VLTTDFSCIVICVHTSNGNASETKANESFDNGVFFDIDAKRSEHVYINELKNRSEANTFDSSKIYFEVKRTCLY